VKIKLKYFVCLYTQHSNSNHSVVSYAACESSCEKEKSESRRERARARMRRWRHETFSARNGKSIMKKLICFFLCWLISFQQPSLFSRSHFWFMTPTNKDNKNEMISNDCRVSERMATAVESSMNSSMSDKELPWMRESAELRMIPYLKILCC
jgi:hypothetical protein